MKYKENNKEKILILKVRKNKSNNQKLITIPKNVEYIKEGDYIKIEKIELK